MAFFYKVGAIEKKKKKLGQGVLCISLDTWNDLNMSLILQPASN